MGETRSHTFASENSVAEPAAPRVFGERYEVVKALKKGNGIETLLGTDLHDGQKIVIKTASRESVSAGAHMRLEHEASVLRQLDSLAFAPLLHLGHDHGLLYLVMPFVAGVSLAEK